MQRINIQEVHAMDNSLISVIIPVYNVEDYLEECIDSVLNQTYKKTEIILINDGSTDSSHIILERYSYYSNIIILSQENSGQSVARNKGMKVAKGEYIYFLDSDDYISPKTFEDLIQTMKDNNLDLIRFAAQSFADKLDIKIDKEKYDFSKYYDEGIVYNKNEFLKLNFKTFLPSPVLYIMRKDLLENNNLKFPPGIVHEDELFTLEVFLNTKSMMYNSNFYYKRRYREGSTMTSESILCRKKSFESKCIVLKELNNSLVKYTGKLERQLINKRIRAMTFQLLNNYEDIDNNYKKNRIREIRSLSFKNYYYYSIKKTIKKIFSNR